MMVIVRNVTAGREEEKIIAAGKAIETDLKDLLEYVSYTSRRTVAHRLLHFQHFENDHFGPHQDSESEPVAHCNILNSQQGQG